MKIQQAITTLQNLLDTRITYEQIASCLQVSTQAISNRVSRCVDLKDYEIKKIEESFNVKITENITNDNEFFYYPEVFGSCGGGTFIISEEAEKISIPKRFLTTYNKNSKYAVINASGDSMIPAIFDKDKLIIEFCENQQIIDNDIYVFRYGDNLFIKRLSLNINQIVIKSDNAEYDTIKLEVPCDIQIIARVVGLMRERV